MFSGKYEIKKETLYITRMLYTGQVETGEMAESFLIPDFSRFLKKKTVTELLCYLIWIKDAEAINKILADDKHITKKNIDLLIQYAIMHQSYEIQILLTNYKAEKIGFANSENIKKRFKI